MIVTCHYVTCHGSSTMDLAYSAIDKKRDSSLALFFSNCFQLFILVLLLIVMVEATPLHARTPPFRLDFKYTLNTMSILFVLLKKLTTYFMYISQYLSTVQLFFGCTILTIAGPSMTTASTGGIKSKVDNHTVFRGVNKFLNQI